MVLKIGKYTQTPSGRKLKNKYIVYDSDTLRPVSGIKGQTKTQAKKILDRLQKDFTFKKGILVRKKRR